MIEKRTELSFEQETEKKAVIDLIDQWRFDMGLGVEEINGDKPWGAYWKIDKRYLGQFLKMFFPEKYLMIGEEEINLSPKLLLVAPHEQLSWQYHERRAENWAVVTGDVAVKLSENDSEPELAEKFVEGEEITIGNGVRHRLVGGEGWGLVAEIWIHMNPEKPSDEEDIVRLVDDYGREK